MKSMKCAVNWALAILVMALGSAFGIVERDTATTMILVFSVLAAMQIADRRQRTDCTSG